VITQPDRPVGRGQKLKFSPVKELALKHDIEILQPEKIRNPKFMEQFQKFSADLAVVAAYGQIFPKSLLEIPKNGFINVHASYLPFYRGAAPIHQAIIDGKKETGVTIMLVNEGMDTGDMLLQEKLPIMPTDTVATLHDKLAQNGARLLGKALDKLGGSGWTRVPQDHAKATYAPLLKKDDGMIHWQKSAREIHSQIRGMNPWPGCFTYFNGKLLKVFTAEICDQEAKVMPGSIVEISETNIAVAAGTGTLVLKEIQLEGKKRMPVEEFIKGKTIKAGDVLSSEK